MSERISRLKGQDLVYRVVQGRDQVAEIMKAVSHLSEEYDLNEVKNEIIDNIGNRLQQFALHPLEGMNEEHDRKKYTFTITDFSHNQTLLALLLGKPIESTTEPEVVNCLVDITDPSGENGDAQFHVRLSNGSKSELNIRARHFYDDMDEGYDEVLFWFGVDDLYTNQVLDMKQFNGSKEYKDWNNLHLSAQMIAILEAGTLNKIDLEIPS